MIRRLLIGVTAMALGAAAFVLPAPAIELPSFPAVSPVSARTGVASSAVSYCPWAQADDTRDTALSVASLAESSVTLSFPSGGETGPETELEVAGPGALTLSVGSILRKGAAPAVVELSDGRGASAAVVRSEGLLAGDSCPRSIPKVWQLPGGSTREGEQLTLRFFNPFPEDASLSLSAVSEFGVEAPSQFEALTVASRGWRDVDLTALLGLREQLALTVTTGQGLVIPTMLLQAGTDVAAWSGVGQSRTWEFPVVQVQDLVPTLAILNPATADVAFDIDVFGSTATPAVVSEVIPAGGEVRVPLEGLVGGNFGVRLQGDGPLSAILLGAGSAGVAATGGAPQTSTRWVVPGLELEGADRSDVWLMNSSTEAITVSVMALDAEGALGEADKVALPPGSVRQLSPPQPGTSALVAESLAPFSLSWTAESAGAVVYSSGVAIDG